MCCCHIPTEVLLAYIFYYTDETIYSLEDLYDFLDFLKVRFFVYVTSDLDEDNVEFVCECNPDFFEIRYRDNKTFVQLIQKPNIQYINDRHFPESISKYMSNLTKIWYKDKYRRRNELD